MSELSLVMIFCRAFEIALTIPTDDDSDEEFDDVDVEFERELLAAAAAATDDAAALLSFCLRAAAAAAAA